MTFPLHASGPFTDDLSTLPASLVNDWRTQWPNAMDGSAGGTYAPSSALTIGGSGVTMTGPTKKSGSTATTQWRQDRTTIVDAAVSITVAQDTYYALTVLTADRVVTFSATGAVVGDRICVVLGDIQDTNTKKLTMHNHDATPMGNSLGTTAESGFFEAEFDGTDWHPRMWSDEFQASIAIT